MNDQYYLFLTAADCLDIYPSNVPQDFRVELSPFIQLGQNEEWSIAVTELIVVPGTDSTFTLCMDVCDSSRLGIRRAKVLRKFYPLRRGKKQLYTFDYPYYMRLTRKYLDVLHFYIIDESGDKLSFDAKTLKITLHLRRNTPWNQS